MTEATLPLITVVVVTFRARDLLAACLDSLAAQTTPHRVLVIDNASTDGTTELLAHRFPQVPVVRLPTNTGFAGGLAAGLARVGTRWTALLNDDATAAPDWLAELVSVARREPGAAAVTSRMLLGDGDRINNLGVGLTRQGYGFDLGLGRPADDGFGTVTEVFGFSGGAALLDTAAVRAVGGSPAEFFLYYEDTDLSWRLRLAGHRVVSAPDAVVRHRHSASVGQHSALFHFHNERNRLLMLLRCAPARFAVTQVVRFGLTTASLTVRYLRGARPPELNLRPGLRLRVLLALIRAAPTALAARQRISRRTVRDRATVAAEWLGRDGEPGQPTASA